MFCNFFSKESISYTIMELNFQRDMKIGVTGLNLAK